MDLWSWLSANGAVVEALATVVAAAIAATALGSAALDSRKRTRAIVVAELEPAEHNDSAGILVVRNVGPTPARDLCVQFDPPLDPSDEHEIYRALIDRYSQPIDTLGPQQRLCNVWWSTRPSPKDPTVGVNSYPTPDQVTVTVSFKTEGSVRRITATYRLDVRVLKAETTSVSSTSTLGTARDSARSLKQISSALGGLEKNSQPQLRN